MVYTSIIPNDIYIENGINMIVLSVRYLDKKSICSDSAPPWLQAFQFKHN